MRDKTSQALCRAAFQVNQDISSCEHGRMPGRQPSLRQMALSSTVPCRAFFIFYFSNKLRHFNSSKFSSAETRENLLKHTVTPLEITSHFQAKQDKMKLLLEVKQHNLKLVLKTNIFLCCKLLRTLPVPLWNIHYNNVCW